MLRRLFHSWEHKLARRDNNRVVRPFDWGTEFLDHKLSLSNGGNGHQNGNGKNAREAIFDFNRRAIANSRSFFESQPVPDFSLEGEWLKFESVVRTPYAENNIAQARYFPVPARAGALNGSRRSEVDRARARAVVVLPHWNAKATEHVALCELLNRAGLAAVRLSLPYPMENAAGSSARTTWSARTSGARFRRTGKRCLILVRWLTG